MSQYMFPSDCEDASEEIDPSRNPSGKFHIN